MREALFLSGVVVLFCAGLLYGALFLWGVPV